LTETAPLPVPPPTSQIGSQKLQARALYDFAGTGPNEMPLKSGTIITIISRGPAGGWTKGPLGAFPTDYVEFLPDASQTSAPIFNNISAVNSIPASKAPSQNVPATGSNTMLNSAKSNSNPFDDLMNEPLQSTASQPTINSSSNSSVMEAFSVQKDLFQPQMESKIEHKEHAHHRMSIKDTKASFATVKYSRVATGPTELTIEKGDTILVQDMKGGEWWYGSIVGKSSAPGYFPSNYVDLKQSSVQNSSQLSLRTNEVPLSTNAQLSTATLSQKEQPATQVNQQAVSSKKVSSNNSNALSESSSGARTMISACSKVGLSGSYNILRSPSANVPLPVWKLPFFVDMFLDEYKSSLDINDHDYEGLPVIQRFRSTLEVFMESSRYIDMANDTISEDIRRVLDKVIYTIRDSIDICRSVPNHCEDFNHIYTYLVTFMVRIRSLRAGEYLMVPLTWKSANDSDEHLIVLLIMKGRDSHQDGYTLHIVNASNDSHSGIEYHPPNVNSCTGTAGRKISLELSRIPDEKMQNTAFW